MGLFSILPILLFRKERKYYKLMESSDKSWVVEGFGGGFTAGFLRPLFLQSKKKV
jgi:hypothetical protein